MHSILSNQNNSNDQNNSNHSQQQQEQHESFVKQKQQKKAFPIFFSCFVLISSFCYCFFILFFVSAVGIAPVD